MNRRALFSLALTPFLARLWPRIRVIEYATNTTGMIGDITRSTYPWWRNQQTSATRVINNDVFRAVRLVPIYREYR